MENQKLTEKEKEEEKITDEELNEETISLIIRLKHSKRKIKNRYYFNWDKGELKLLDSKNDNKEVNLTNKKLEESLKNKNDQINELQNNINETHNDNNELKNNINERQKNINEIQMQNNTNEKKEEKNEMICNEDEKEEIQKLFEDFDQHPDEFFKNNSKKNIENEYQLIINLNQSKEEEKPLYIKCISSQLITKENEYLLYIFRDMEAGEINAYVYDKDISKFKKKIKLNCVYAISNYLVKPKVSSSFLRNNFRIILNDKTKVKPMPPDPDFNKIHFNFINIEDLFYFKPNTVLDICGIIYDEGKLEIVRTRFGNKKIRNILIGDTSKSKVVITLWEKFSNIKNIKYKIGEIIAIKYCKIILYPEKTKKLTTSNLSFIQNSTSNYEKDKELIEFYKKHNNINEFSFVSSPVDYLYLEELKSIIINNIQNEIDNCNIPFLTKAYICQIILDDKCIFNGCPICRKKLDDINDNERKNLPKEINFKCLSCKKNFEKSRYIFKLSFQARDAKEKVFFNMIGDEAEKFLNIEPDVVKGYLDEENRYELKKVEDNTLNTEYIFLGKLLSYKSKISGRIVNKAKIDHFEKAEGENLKKILNLVNKD